MEAGEAHNLVPKGPVGSSPTSATSVVPLRKECQERRIPRNFTTQRLSTSPLVANGCSAGTQSKHTEEKSYHPVDEDTCRSTHLQDERTTGVS